jgi:hypothetical protein
LQIEDFQIADWKAADAETGLVPQSGFLNLRWWANAKIGCSRRLRDLEPFLNRAASGLDCLISKALHCAPPNESALLAWPVACGSAVAERTRAVSFADGILQIEVSDAGWRRELTNLAPRYLAAINKYSSATVKRIEFMVKG